MALALVVTAGGYLATRSPAAADIEISSLETGFRNPPMTARPSVYYLLLNGFVDLDHMERELRQYRDAGLGGLCVFDMGARGDPAAQPPAGPAFLSPESAKALGRILRGAGKLGMEVDLSVSSSWDMGGSWVKPEDGSMTLLTSEVEVEGPGAYDAEFPFPPTPAETPKDGAGKPLFFREVALLAFPHPRRLPGHEFLFQLPGRRSRQVVEAVFFNVGGGEAAKDVSIEVSVEPPERSAFHEVWRGALQAREGPQRFRFPAAEARFVRLRILSSHDAGSSRVRLAEFELRTPAGDNALISHYANRGIDGAQLLRFTSELGIAEWAASKIHDGVMSGPRGSWSSAGPPPLLVEDSRKIVDLSGKIDASGRLRWEAPPGRWLIHRYVCTNTGERLKVPSPNSDGLATDHLNAGATRRYLQNVIDRLRPEIGDFRRSALRELYLASYEVRGQIWTPDFLDQFRARRGYDLKPYLPILNGGRVDGEDTTERVRYDFRKTVGELLVDAYYRAASEVAHEAGLGIESEAGGPGPPIHQVPVDALQALGAVDAVRGEFWPYRPDARSLWVIKETAAAAHIYGKRRVHMEAFTSSRHWQEGPGDIKWAADRAFCEGMNHVVWHTAAHQPPASGQPGWVYYAGTHLTPNRVWWPMARPFLDYLARASFLLQQGLFVGDVLYYYGDQGFNFVGPKEVDPSLGFGYDYDVTNAEVILSRITVDDGRIALPDGTRYEILVLPDRDDIDLAVLRKLEALISAGATVAGRRPERTTGFSGYPDRDRELRELAARVWGDCDGRNVRRRAYGKGLVVCGESLREVLRGRGVGPDFEFRGARSDTSLDFIHRRTPGADIYFVRNVSDRWEDVEAVFRVKARRPELWFPDTGEVRATAYEAAEAGVKTPLRLEPLGSVFVVFPAPGSVSRTLPGLVEVTESSAPIEVEGPWDVRFTPGWGAPDSVMLPKLISWTDHANEGVRYYSGIGTYRTSFHVDAAWLGKGRIALLDLGDLWSAARVSLNGKPGGIAWKRPYRLDVTGALRAGSNELVVEVANTWNNRLVGDALGAGGRKYTRTNVTGDAGVPWAKVPLRRSGLFGPVRLVTARAHEAP